MPHLDLTDGGSWPLIVVGATATLVGLWPLLWMLRRVGRRLRGRAQRPVSAARYFMALIVSLLFLTAALAILSLAALLGSWRAFTKQTQIAEVQAFELSPHHLRVYLVPIASHGARGPTESYDVDGDQWQVGGDVLRFRPFLTVLGIDTAYRMTRVEGRWNDAASANSHTGTAYDRRPASWAWTRLYRDADRPPLSWFIAGAHGQSVAQLPDRRALYDVYVTPNGYVVDKRGF